MEKSKLLFCQKLINLQNLKNVTHIENLKSKFFIDSEINKKRTRLYKSYAFNFF